MHDAGRSARDAFLALSSDFDLDEPVTDQTELVASGRLDSLALFRLALWAEEQTGHQLDPTAFEPAIEWATVGRFLAFVETVRRAGAPRRPRELDARARFGGRECLFTEYVPGMKRSVAAFQRTLWGQDEAVNQRYLEWKYEINPFAVDSRIYLAYCGEELVAMRGFYGSLWESGQPPLRVPILVADDLLIHEAFRSTGLFNYLMQYALDDLARKGHVHILNLGANQLNVAGSLSTGWRIACSLRPLSRASLARKLHKIVRQSVARLPVFWRWSDSRRLYAASEREPFAYLDKHPRLRLSTQGLRVETARDAPIDDIVRLVDALPYDGRIRHVRSAEYLRWRFANPLADYRFVAARDRDGRLCGYAALRANPARGHVTVTIADLEVTNDQAIDALLEHVLGHGRVAEVLVWGESLSRASEATFRRHGFSDVARRASGGAGDKILVKFAPGDAESTMLGKRLIDQSAWDMRMLYSMRG